MLRVQCAGNEFGDTNGNRAESEKPAVAGDLFGQENDVAFGEFIRVTGAPSLLDRIPVLPFRAGAAHFGHT
jgi:hypothetical protein